MEEKKIKMLVADTTAFINNINLNDYAEKIFTVPDVVNEVKNKRQIRRLVVLPFDLQIREPRTDSVIYVTDFAKKTGDYSSLSSIDMKVIALTYELHKDNEGSENLRKEPLISKIVVSKEKPVEFEDDNKIAGFYVPKALTSSDTEKDSEKECKNDKLSFRSKSENFENNKIKTLNDESFEKNSENSLEVYEIHEVSKPDPKINGKCHSEQICDSYEEKFAEVSDSDLLENIKNITLNDNLYDILPSEKSENEEYFSESSDSDSDWITPCNIQKIKKEIEGKLEDTIPFVACMTTDFALQNVLKQINLNICALDGRVIKQIRTYILRCYACFKTTSIMTKIFCTNCGNKTLKRVAVSLDENGKQVIHINTKRPLTAKFKNQSLPRPKGGKHSRNPIVVEDQPMPKQMPSRVAKTKTQALNEDYVAGYSPFATRDLNSKSALLRSKGHIKEWARNNTFEEQRRKKYFNRLVK